jgi:hypothetical protein
MRIKQVLQNLDVLLRLFLRTWWDRMAWHWYRERKTLGVLKVSLVRLQKRQAGYSTHCSGKYLLQPRGGSLGFGLAAVEAVIEFEQRLAHGVREGDLTRIDERDFANTPTLAPTLTSEAEEADEYHVTHHERSRNVASQSSRAQQQASRLCDLLQVERRENPPAHQFQIKVYSLVREPVVDPSHQPCFRHKKTKQTSWDPSLALGQRSAHPVFPARSSPIRLRSACLCHLAHRAECRNDSRRHRRASRVHGRPVLSRDVRRGGMRGGYVGATPVRKVAPKGRETR